MPPFARKILLLALFVLTPTVARAADRYWVGGTESWGGVGGNRWATCSGCAGGASVPTSSDNVFFDANSGAVTVTVAAGNTGCLNLDFTGFTGTFTVSTSMTISGGLTVASGMTWGYSASGALTFDATSGTHTITSSGKTLPLPITFNGVGGTWQLGDALNIGTSTVTLTNGTFNANNQTVSIGDFSSSNSNTRTLTMGSGTWNLGSGSGTIWNTATTTNLTLNPDTALLDLTSNTSTTRTLDGGGATLPSIRVSAGIASGVTFTNINCNDLTFTSGYTGTLSNQAITIRGSLTLPATGPTFSAGTNAWTFAATSGTKTITTNGRTVDWPLTFDGAGGTWQLADNLTVGSTRTVTLTNGTFDANNKNVTMGLFSSDNSNTRTITMGSGTWTITGSGGTIWTTETGTGLTLNQGSNPVVFNYSGSTGRTIRGVASDESRSVDFSITAGTGDVSVSYARNLDFTGFAGTWNDSIAPSIYGSLTVSSGMTSGGSGNWINFLATSGTHTITTNGTTINAPIVFDGVGGTWQLADSLTVASTRTVMLTNGTFNANNKNVTIGRFSSSNSNTRTLTMGTGTWTVTGGNNVTPWDTAAATNLTLNRGNAVLFNYSGGSGSRTINAGATEATSIDVSVTAGTDTVNINSARTVNFTGFTGTLTNGARTLYGGLTVVSGMTLDAGSSVTTFGATSGTYTITTNGKTLDFPITFNGSGGTWQLGDSIVIGSSRTVTLTAGTFNANGMNFTAGSFVSSNTNTRTLTMGTGTWTLGNNGTLVWDTETSTNLTLNSGNPVIASYTGATGTRTLRTGATEAVSVDFNITGGTDTISLGNARTVDFTGFTGTLNLATRTLYGGLTLTGGMTTSSGNMVTTFAATSGTHTITTNGNQVGFYVTFDGVGGTWQLGDSFAYLNNDPLTLTNGTFNANDQNLSIGSFVSSNSNTRTLMMGIGTWTLKGAGTIWDMSTATGMTLNANTALIDVTNAGVSDRTITAANYLLPSLQVSNGGGAVTIANVMCEDLTFTSGFTGSWASSDIQVRGSLTLGANMTVTGGNNTITMAASGGTKTITSNGKTLDRHLNFDQGGGGAGATWQLADSLTVGSTRTVTLTEGILNANNQNVSMGAFSSSNSNTRAVTMGNGTWTLASSGAVWDATTGTNLTVTPNASIITINDASASSKTFAGGDKTYNNLVFTGAGTGNLDVTGSNTFNNFAIETPPKTVRFTAGTTTTVTTFNAAGTHDNRITITSPTAAQHTLAKAGGGTIRNLEYTNISYSNASPAGTWYSGRGARNQGNNTQWIFPRFPTNMIPMTQ